MCLFVITGFCLSNSITFCQLSRLSLMKEQWQWFSGMNSLTGGLETEWITHQGGIRGVTVERFWFKITITSSQEHWNPDAAYLEWLEHRASHCVWMDSFHSLMKVFNYRKNECVIFFVVLASLNCLQMCFSFFLFLFSLFIIGDVYMFRIDRDEEILRCIDLST